MSVFESIERYPVDYLPTGDRALLLAWMNGEKGVSAVVVLEDGRLVEALLEELKLDFRYDSDRMEWVDVSRPAGMVLEDLHANADQAPEDDGSEAVSGRFPDLDGAGESDQDDEP